MRDLLRVTENGDGVKMHELRLFIVSGREKRDCGDASCQRCMNYTVFICTHMYSYINIPIE